MADPFLVIDPTDHAPPSVQIASQIRTLVTSGVLSPGAPLPSVRQLARDLGLAPNTVVRAYAELEDDGWIVPQLRRGFTVADNVGELAPGERSRQLDMAAQQLAETAHLMKADAQEVHALVDRWLRHAVS